MKSLVNGFIRRSTDSLSPGKKKKHNSNVRHTPCPRLCCKKTFVVTLVSYVKRRSYNQPLTETHHSEAGQQSRSSAGGFQLGSAQVELSPGQRLQRVLVQTHSVKVVPLHFFLAFVCLKSSTKLQLQFRLHRVRRAKVR